MMQREYRISAAHTDLAATGPPLNAEKETSTDPKDKAGSQGVRFTSGLQEITPSKNDLEKTTIAEDSKQSEDISLEAKEEIRNLAMSLQKSKLQENRMHNFQFEPVSLPASRVSPALSSQSGPNPSGLIQCIHL